MKKTILATLTASLFLAGCASSNSSNEPANPIEVTPVNPIEKANPSNPVEVTPVNPIEDNTPTNPVEVKNKIKALSAEQRQQIKQAINTRLPARS